MQNRATPQSPIGDSSPYTEEPLLPSPTKSDAAGGYYPPAASFLHSRAKILIDTTHGIYRISWRKSHPLPIDSNVRIIASIF